MSGCLLTFFQGACIVYYGLCLLTGSLGTGKHMWNVTPDKFMKNFQVSDFQRTILTHPDPNIRIRSAMFSKSYMDPLSILQSSLF